MDFKTNLLGFEDYCDPGDNLYPSVFQRVFNIIQDVGYCSDTVQTIFTNSSSSFSRGAAKRKKDNLGSSDFGDALLSNAADRFPQHPSLPGRSMITREVCTPCTAPLESETTICQGIREN